LFSKKEANSFYFIYHIFWEQFFGPAVEGAIRTTGEKAWHSVYSMLRTKETQIREPNEFYCTLYSVQSH
jgi:hypothetical protein